MLRWYTQEFQTQQGQWVLVRLVPLVDHFYLEIRSVLAPGVSIPIQPPKLVRRQGIVLLNKLAQFGIRPVDADAWLTEQFGHALSLHPRTETK